MSRAPLNSNNERTFCYQEHIENDWFVFPVLLLSPTRWNDWEESSVHINLQRQIRKKIKQTKAMNMNIWSGNWAPLALGAGYSLSTQSPLFFCLRFICFLLRLPCLLHKTDYIYISRRQCFIAECSDALTNEWLRCITQTMDVVETVIVVFPHHRGRRF